MVEDNSYSTGREAVQVVKSTPYARERKKLLENILLSALLLPSQNGKKL